MSRAVGQDVRTPSRARADVEPVQVHALHDVAPPDADEVDRLRAALAVAAHELRLPVAVIAGLTALLQDRRDSIDPETVSRMVDALARQAAVLDRVTRDLLVTTQLERGTVAVSPERVPVAPVLRAAVTGRNDVHLDCPEDLTACADPVRLAQMVGNLLANADKYGAPPLSLTAAAAGDEVEIRVSDSGEGVPESFRPRMFDEYSRLRDGPHGSGGTGIGLFVVRTLARMQNGTVRYETGPGGGACLVVTLPQADAGGGR